MPLDDAILGKGVYTPREAARLTRTTPQHVLRWTRGSGPNQPLWNAHYQFLDDDVTEISFLDLVEVRVVTALRKASISLQSIRFAMAFAKDKFGIERPLASQSFRTDGSEILMEAVEMDGQFVSLSKKSPGQKVFRKIIEQSLNDLEYDNDLASRWRPNKFSSVIIDPARHFGDPILDEFGISTSVLYQEFLEFRDLNYLAKIYEIPKQTISLGIAFEEDLEEANG
ncbi:hypothetical protein [Roseovarius rhodophyticola]|uniref:DUF433 domain-containing protein n=1 Tax=Roseovarius rhodophyticola TaxID=3080827 RepID=A0ABZ2TKT7_9RHOB|nr:hypothetical protein [Roseovarius sp. W115]MDV2928643.1 hypothetical protein [Roseovarius sp. W115]